MCGVRDGRAGALSVAVVLASVGDDNGASRAQSMYAYFLSFAFFLAKLVFFHIVVCGPGLTRMRIRLLLQAQPHCTSSRESRHHSLGS